MKIEEIIKSTIPMDISKQVMLNITFTKNIITDKFHEILKPFDISEEQYNVLRILRGQKGKPANMYIIQERMITKNSNTTRLIDKLLLKGMVTRDVCPANRRKIEINITEKGLKVLENLDPKIQGHDESFTKNLNHEELKELNFLLEKLRTFKTK